MQHSVQQEGTLVSSYHGMVVGDNGYNIIEPGATTRCPQAAAVLSQQPFASFIGTRTHINIT